MVGIASCSSKKTGYGTVRKPQSLAATNKLHKSGQNMQRDLCVGHNTDAESNEPLSNPNWRRRPTGDGQDDLRTTAPKQMESLDGKVPVSKLPLHDKFSSFQSYSIKRQQNSRESFSKPAVESGNLIESHCHADDSFATWATAGGFLDRRVQDRHILDVVDHINLHDQGIGRTLDLFGVVPSRGSSYSDKRCTLLKTRSGDDAIDQRFCQLMSSKHGTKLDESQGNQLIAALKATEATPRKVGGSSSSSTSASQRSSGLSEQSELHIDSSKGSFRSRRFGSKDSGFSTSSRSQEDLEYGSKNTEQQAPGNFGPDEKNLGKRDIAFQKLIQKLRGPAPQDKKGADHGSDSGYEGESIRTQGHQSGLPEEDPVHEKRRPIHGIGRRVNTVSDDVLRYWPASRSWRGHCSTDSTGGDSVEKCNSLNPKAREFLSFSHKIPATSGKSRRLPFCFSDISSEEQASGPHHDNASSAPTEPQDPVVSRNQPLLPDGLLPVPFMNTPSIPIVLQPLNDSTPPLVGLIPLMPDAYKPTAGQPDALPNCPSAANIRDGGWAPQTKIFGPPLTQDSPFYGCPPLPSQVKLDMANTSMAPLPLHATNAIPPRRVAKPKQPNPKEQQDYEAWVEWRKATEPGYAMSCKLRQQRRMQRKGSKTKEENQPKPASESLFNSSNLAPCIRPQGDSET